MTGGTVGGTVPDEKVWEYLDLIMHGTEKSDSDEGHGWVHSSCLPCWYLNEPERDPVRVRFREEEHCCWCGRTHHSGIYVRVDPELVPLCSTGAEITDPYSEMAED